jgi:hypothetical protein
MKTLFCLLLIAFLNTALGQIYSDIRQLNFGTRVYNGLSALGPSKQFNIIPAPAPSLSISLLSRVYSDKYFMRTELGASIYSYGYKFNINVPTNSKYFNPPHFTSYDGKERVLMAPTSYLSISIGKLFKLGNRSKNTMFIEKAILLSGGISLNVLPIFESVTSYHYVIKNDSTDHLGALYAVYNPKRMHGDLFLELDYHFRLKKRLNGIRAKFNYSPSKFILTQFSADLDPVIFTNLERKSMGYIEIGYRLGINKIKKNEF